MDHEGLRFKVLETDGARIERLEVRWLDEDERVPPLAAEA